MKFMSGYYTSSGAGGRPNQDSFSIRFAEYPGGDMVQIVLCDGMGGLADGEKASAAAVLGFHEWFTHGAKTFYRRGLDWDWLETEWRGLVRELNRAIYTYGQTTGCRLGTTVTAMMAAKDSYRILQVGDCRVYAMEAMPTQLTVDQTAAVHKMMLGQLTKEEANRDPARNVLLQCVGASAKCRPVFYGGSISAGGMFLICSDGFWHHMEDGKVRNHVAVWSVRTEDKKEKCSWLPETYFSGICKDAGEECVRMGEPDNITAIMIGTAEAEGQ